MPLKLSEIKALPRGQQRPHLREYVSATCLHHEYEIKRTSGKTWAAWRDSLTMTKLERLAGWINDMRNGDRPNLSRADIEAIHNETSDPLGQPNTQTTAPKETQETNKVTDAQANVINTILDGFNLPKIETLMDSVDKVKDLEQKLKASTLLAPTPTAYEPTSSSIIPKGKPTTEKAYKVFGTDKKKFDFDVIVWDWDAPNPHVPMIDPNYIFRSEELMKVLYALITNQRAYLYGDTGTGKTTLIEQVAARLKWMFGRINFDSEISRFDLIGRDILISEDGKTVSKFVDGLLPQFMSTPTIACFDEIDFVRPDVAYVMQSALEGNGLVITEDGGRIVRPHSHFRMFATGNTQGQGDEKGMYQGARPQSLALLDRFTVWAKIDYLDAKQRRNLVIKKCPTLEPPHIDIVCDYVTEHLKAFKDAHVMQPISPRGMISLGNAIATFTQLDPTDKKKAIKRAFQTTITDRATSQDFAVLNGIVDRVVK